MCVSPNESMEEGWTEHLFVLSTVNGAAARKRDPSPNPAAVTNLGPKFGKSLGRSPCCILDDLILMIAEWFARYGVKFWPWNQLSLREEGGRVDHINGRWSTGSNLFRSHQNQHLFHPSLRKKSANLLRDDQRHSVCWSSRNVARPAIHLLHHVYHHVFW